MIERASIGVKGMDEMLNGGIPKGKCILLSGASGTGKTIFASQYAREGAENGEPCVYVTFEQGRERLVQDMKEIEIDFEELERAGKIRIIGGPIGNISYFKEKTKAAISDIISEIKEVVHEINAKRVVIDSVNLFTMLFQTNAERRRAMANLCAALSAIGCTSLLTSEVREGTNDISWYGFEEFVVDGVITLYRTRVENTFERAVAIIKMRGIEHSQNISALKISSEGLIVYPEQEPFYKPAGNR